MALGAQRKYPEALAEVRKEEEISPNKIQAYQMAASVANMAGNRDEAIVELRKLLKVDPRNASVAFSLSQWLSQDGKYAEAAEVLEKDAISRDHRRHGIRVGLGIFENGRNRKEHYPFACGSRG